MRLLYIICAYEISFYFTAVRMLEQYLQCTPPPQYDLFPQKCSSSVDCFPNLCCAEGGKKHCRPPQRSLIALLAGVGQVYTNLLIIAQN